MRQKVKPNGAGVRKVFEKLRTCGNYEHLVDHSIAPLARAGLRLGHEYRNVLTLFHNAERMEHGCIIGKPHVL